MLKRAGNIRPKAFGEERLRSGMFYTVVYIALASERLGEWIMTIKGLLQRLNSASTVKVTYSVDTSQGCDEVTHSGQSLSVVDTAAKPSYSTPEPRGKGKFLSQEQANRIRALYNDGESVINIAKQFGVSRWTCYKIISYRSHSTKWDR